MKIVLCGEDTESEEYDLEDLGGNLKKILENKKGVILIPEEGNNTLFMDLYWIEVFLRFNSINKLAILYPHFEKNKLCLRFLKDHKDRFVDSIEEARKLILKKGEK